GRVAHHGQLRRGRIVRRASEEEVQPGGPASGEVLATVPVEVEASHDLPPQGAPPAWRGPRRSTSRHVEGRPDPVGGPRHAVRSPAPAPRSFPSLTEPGPERPGAPTRDIVHSPAEAVATDAPNCSLEGRAGITADDFCQWVSPPGEGRKASTRPTKSPALVLA